MTAPDKSSDKGSDSLGLNPFASGKPRPSRDFREDRERTPTRPTHSQNRAIICGFNDGCRFQSLLEWDPRLFRLPTDSNDGPEEPRILAKAFGSLVSWRSSARARWCLEEEAQHKQVPRPGFTVAAFERRAGRRSCRKLSQAPLPMRGRMRSLCVGVKGPGRGRRGLGITSAS